MTQVLCRDARKIFRLFKSVNEIQILKNKVTKDLIWQPKKLPIFFDILTRIGFFFYWLFDNIQILANIKFIKGEPPFHAKMASFGWIIGLIFGIARNFYDLTELLVMKQNAEKEQDKKKGNIDFLILKALVDITGKLGDLIPALNGTGIPKLIMGQGFSEASMSLGGLWAALVSLWNVYLK